MSNTIRTVTKSMLFTASLSAAIWAAPDALAAPRTHDGFYLQLDAGLGYLSTSASAGGAKVTYSGVTLPSALLIGGSLMPGLVLGGTIVTDYAPSPGVSIAGQSGNFTGASLYLFGIGPFVDFYPDPASGLHFQAMVGYGGLQATYKGNVSNGGPTGVVLSVGGGYDFWVADEWSIGVMGRFAYAPLSESGVGFSTIAPAVLATFTYN
jgi:hypothetical protein